MSNGASSYTITPEEQMAMAGQYRQAKGGKDTERENEEERRQEGQERTYRQTVAEARKRAEESAFYKTGRSFQKVIEKQSKIEAIKQGVFLGIDLRRQISEMRFDAFIVVLILSLIKDFIDIPVLLANVLSLGTIGTVVGILINLAVTIALFIIFLLRKSWLKRYLIKRFIWPIIIEFIPFIRVFPTYTLAILFLKRKIDKKRRKKEGELEQAEMKTNQLIKEVNS